MTSSGSTHAEAEIEPQPTAFSQFVSLTLWERHFAQQEPRF